MLWTTYVSAIREKLTADNILAPAYFDLKGFADSPDSVMDGLIVITPSAHGATYYPAPEFDKRAGINTGPFIIAGTDATPAEILRAFAAMTGITDRAAFCPHCIDTCPSISDPSDKGFPLIDAVTRIRSGWALLEELSGPPATIYFAPSRTTGKVYYIASGNDYILIENRSYGEGYDISLSSPGLAIYHLSFDRPSPTSPFGATTCQCDSSPYAAVSKIPPSAPRGQQFACGAPANSLLFRNGDSLTPDYANQSPTPLGNSSHNTNTITGAPSGITIDNIDTISHFPVISARVGISH